MIVEYKPSSKFSGVVKLKMPRYKERLELIKQMNLKTVIKNGVAAIEDTDKFDTAIFLADVVDKFVDSIDLKHIENGIEIKTIEELECYADGLSLISELGGVLFHGVELGKN